MREREDDGRVRGGMSGRWRVSGESVGGREKDGGGERGE